MSALGVGGNRVRAGGKVALPLVLKRALFILVCKNCWQDSGKDMNLFNRKIFIHSSFILFYDIIYIIKYGSESHPKE